MLSAIEVAKKLESHVSGVAPGQPFHLTDVHTVGDLVWQGDLGIEVVAGVPKDYIQVDEPTDADRQLVPESGQGSHHRLKSLDGVKLYRPKDWGKSDTDLRGPCAVCSKPNAIVHEPGHARPHGTVFIDCPMTVLGRYQRNLNIDNRAKRAID